MSNNKRLDFDVAVKAVHDAVDELAEGMMRQDWFARGLDVKLRDASERLIKWETEAETETTKVAG